MRVVLRNPRRREIQIAGNRQVLAILEELGLNPESVVVVQGGALLTRDAYVADDGEIEVISAISGGS